MIERSAKCNREIPIEKMISYRVNRHCSYFPRNANKNPKLLGFGWCIDVFEPTLELFLVSSPCSILWSTLLTDLLTQSLPSYSRTPIYLYFPCYTFEFSELMISTNHINSEFHSVFPDSPSGISLFELVYQLLELGIRETIESDTISCYLFEIITHSLFPCIRINLVSWIECTLELREITRYFL